MDLVQPDPADAARILATCPRCGRWYLRIAPPCGRATLRALDVPTLEELGRVVPMPSAG